MSDIFLYFKSHANLMSRFYQGFRQQCSTPDEDTLGVYGVWLSTLEISLVLGSNLTLFLSVTPMGEVIRGRIESSGFSGKHVEPLEGEELDTIASLFEARIQDATEKLLAARIGL